MRAGWEGSKQAENISNRCKNALAYEDVTVRFSWRDKDYLRSLYDLDMDSEALFTLNKIMGM